MSDKERQSLSREDFEQALDEMGHVLDVSVNDLMEVTDKARKHAMLRRKETILIRDVMSHPVTTVAPDTTLAEAADRMLSNRVSGLPVVEQDKRLAGIITEADFLCALGVPCHQRAQNLWQRLEEIFAARTPELHEPGDNVASIMARHVVTARPEQILHDALELMKTHQVKRLVVVDEHNSPVGMITRSDLVRAFFRQLGRKGSQND